LAARSASQELFAAPPEAAADFLRGGIGNYPLASQRTFLIFGKAENVLQ
jgi:hypothetical protein